MPCPISSEWLAGVAGQLRTYGLRGCGPDDRFVRTLAQAVFTAERQPRAALAHHGKAELCSHAQIKYMLKLCNHA